MDAFFSWELNSLGQLSSKYQGKEQRELQDMNGKEPLSAVVLLVLRLLYHAVGQKYQILFDDTINCASVTEEHHLFADVSIVVTITGKPSVAHVPF